MARMILNDRKERGRKWDYLGMLLTGYLGEDGLMYFLLFLVRTMEQMRWRYPKVFEVAPRDAHIFVEDENGQLVEGTSDLSEREE